MPVVVECDVNPSKLRWWYMATPLCLGVIVLWLSNAPNFIYLFLLSAPWLIWQLVKSEIAITHLRLTDGEVVVWEAEERSSWKWHGEGRLSHAFVQLNLLDDDEQTWNLRVWRDSLTDPSWRALNMGFHVNHVEAQRNAEELLN